MQENANILSAELQKLLRANSQAEVVFGAENEPLRQSQIEALQAVKAHLDADETKGYIVQPGGSGKTREGIALAYAMHKAGRRSLFVVPSLQAVEDFAQKARELCPDMLVGAVHSGEKTVGNLTFITYASLMRRTLGEEAAKEAEALDPEGAAKFLREGLKIHPKDYDLVVWDEAHMYLTAHAQDLVDEFRHAVNIGFTATPRYYFGKEVDGIFGKKIYETDFEQAKERREVSDFVNILIDTGLHSGVVLSSREQEESAKMAAGIDKSDRNSLIADFYANAKITVPRTKKTYRLLGEPALVFGATIDHVHHMAEQINIELMPKLVRDEKFRKSLQAKGIDPDKVKAIAAPIHSGGSEAFLPMTRKQKNDLIQDYHDHKILMLVSTSVLQQSFDSPQTSLVIDTVPRQTYVGAGQAAMRGTRYHADTPMKFIVNMQDSDLNALTFTDCLKARGHEEGVVIEIPPNLNPAKKYRTTSGRELKERAVIRAQHERYLENEYADPIAFFKTEVYNKLNHLISQMHTGDKKITHDALLLLQPFVDYAANHNVERLFQDEHLNAQDLHDMVGDALMETVKWAQDGRTPSLQRFSIRFQKRLQDSLREKLHEDHPHWDGIEVAPLTRQIGHCNDAPAKLERSEYLQALKARRGLVLSELEPVQREIIGLKFGLDGKAQLERDEIQDYLKMDDKKFKSLEAQTLAKLQTPSSIERWRDYVPNHYWKDRAEEKRIEQEKKIERAHKNAELITEFLPAVAEQTDKIAQLLRPADYKELEWSDISQLTDYFSGQGYATARHLQMLCGYYDHSNKDFLQLHKTLNSNVVSSILEEGFRVRECPFFDLGKFKNAIGELNKLLETYKQRGGTLMSDDLISARTNGPVR